MKKYTKPTLSVVELSLTEGVSFGGGTGGIVANSYVFEGNTSFLTPGCEPKRDESGTMPD